MLLYSIITVMSRGSAAPIRRRLISLAAIVEQWGEMAREGGERVRR